MKKYLKVSFSDIIIINETHHSHEYDRMPIISFGYLMSYNKIDINEYNIMVDEMNEFKTLEMESHPNSLKNISFLKKKND